MGLKYTQICKTHIENAYDGSTIKCDSNIYVSIKRDSNIQVSINFKGYSIDIQEYRSLMQTVKL